MDFIYDNAGRPYAILNGNATSASIYYYILNQQGDVIRILGPNNTVAATYTYNAWGEVISSSGWMANQNPLRYRGYFQDNETGFYYLQSRYYDPSIGRFINADQFASTGQDFLGCNMFAYCNNNPVNCSDPTGAFAVETMLLCGLFAGIGNAFSTYRTGGTLGEIVKSGIVGAAVGMCAYTVSSYFKLATLANVCVRGVATLVTGVFTQSVTDAEISSYDTAFISFDVFFDMFFSLITYSYIGNDIFNALVDMGNDMLQTISVFSPESSSATSNKSANRPQNFGRGNAAHNTASSNKASSTQLKNNWRVNYAY